ncbi:uncharacterized protein [Paramisgurnus dabryanus]|uniref:uncharacterized protein n=1 Tax=Paramisgurnus dabryanus TaxID=90735 RepID=UPI003CCF8CCB
MNMSVVCPCGKIYKNARGLKIHQSWMKCLEQRQAPQCTGLVPGDSKEEQGPKAPHRAQSFQVVQTVPPVMQPEKRRIKWPQACKTAEWQTFDDYVDKVLEAMARESALCLKKKFVFGRFQMASILDLPPIYYSRWEVDCCESSVYNVTDDGSLDSVLMSRDQSRTPQPLLDSKLSEEKSRHTQDSELSLTLLCYTESKPTDTQDTTVCDSKQSLQEDQTSTESLDSVCNAGERQQILQTKLKMCSVKLIDCTNLMMKIKSELTEITTELTEITTELTEITTELTEITTELTEITTELTEITRDVPIRFFCP